MIQNLYNSIITMNEIEYRLHLLFVSRRKIKGQNDSKWVSESFYLKYIFHGLINIIT